MYHCETSPYIAYGYSVRYIEMENVLRVRDEAGKYDVYGKRVEEDIVTLTHFPY